MRPMKLQKSVFLGRGFSGVGIFLFTLVIFIVCAIQVFSRSDDSVHSNDLLTNVKAFRSLNFGDNVETVEHKLTEILAPESNGNSVEENDIDLISDDRIWSSLSDNDAEYDAYQKMTATMSNEGNTEPDPLRRYFFQGQVKLR